jgi:hypothetical protein
MFKKRHVQPLIRVLSSLTWSSHSAAYKSEQTPAGSGRLPPLHLSLEYSSNSLLAPALMLFSSTILSTVLAAVFVVASPSPRGVPASKIATLSPHSQTVKSSTTVKRSLSNVYNTGWAGPELEYAAVRVSVECAPNLADDKHVLRALSTLSPRRGSSTRRASLPAVVRVRRTTPSRPSVSTMGRARAVTGAGLMAGFRSSAKAPQ